MLYLDKTYKTYISIKQLLFFLPSLISSFRFSLRAKYGTDTIQNAVHSCDTNESAARELAFFFPDFNIPTVQVREKKKRLQRTLALIRPNALAKRREEILKAIEDSGFLIAMQKEVQLTREQAEEFYEEHKDKDYFESLITNMTR